jgi:hypothetical protein
MSQNSLNILLPCTEKSTRESYKISICSTTPPANSKKA